ncbi:unnamed protein product [Rhizophagus irregularis]|nr:unnamed protein product [Rhizophagus irregularis]
MPRKTKRQLQISKLPRKKGCYISKNQAETELEAVEERKESEINENWIEDIEDETINDWAEEDLEEFQKVGKKLITEVLCWHENATSSIRAAYNGTSRTTTWRNKKKKEELAHDAMGMRTLDTLFGNTKLQSLQPQFLPPSNPPLITRDLEIRLKEINQQCSITKSAKTNKNIFTYDYLRRLSIRRYIQLLLDGWGKMDASNQIAQTMWNKGDYIAKCIRKWGAHFIQTGELLVYRQGKHTKLESLLNDEDFKEECQVWLRQQKPESRTPGNLKTYIEGTVFPKLTGHIKKDTISEKTCRNYMHFWGYKYDERKKGVYYDGHERSDVVIYRQEWLKRMFEYQKFMKDFDGNMMDIVSEPHLKPGEKELVQVTHDECHFYANDGQRRIWMREDEDILRSKHQGRSIMVSAFLCQCHGLLRLSDEQLQENPHIKNKESFVIRSIQTDGYWKSEHMLDQVVLMHDRQR